MKKLYLATLIASATLLTGCLGDDNAAPIANDDSFTVDANVATTLDVTSNDADDDGDTLTIEEVTTPTNGTATISGSSISYTPAAGFVGEDSFSYTISDGEDEATATVSITVFNEEPTGVNDTVTADANADNTFDVVANDTDPDGDTLTLTAVSEPTNGVAVITDNAVVYTPTTNYVGADSFTYTATDGVYEYTADVAVTVQATLAISGKVTDSPISDAQVTITVGGQTFTAVADQDGNYTIEVTFSDGSAPLTLNAQGDEANGQDFVTLTSILADLASLLEQAGEDGTLTRDEAGGTNVTNVTTAIYTLMLEENGGEAPTSTDQLNELQAAIDPAKTLQVAAVIKLLIDSPETFQLPEGTTSIADFIEDVEAYNTFVEEVEATNPDAIDTAIAEIIEDPELVEATTPDGLPPYYISTSPTRPGYIAQGSQIFVFGEDGGNQGFVASSDFTEDGAQADMTWEIADDGWVTLTFETPATFTGNPSIYDATDDPALIDAYEAAQQFQVQATYSNDSQRFKVITTGARNDLVQREVSYTVTFAPLEFNGQTYQIPPTTLDENFQSLFINGDKIEFIQVTEADVVGVWTIPLIADFDQSADYRIFAMDVVTMNEDLTFEAEISGVTGTWGITTEGTVDLYYEGAESYLELVDFEGGIYGALVSAETVDGSISGDFTWVAKMQEGAAFDGAEMLTAADESWFAAINAWSQSSWDEATDQPTIGSYYGWQFQDSTVGYFNQIGCEEFFDLGYCSYTASGDTQDTTNVWIGDQMQWSILDDGRMRVYRKQICDGFGLNYDCRGRFWWPFLVDYENDRIVVLEHSEANFSGDPEAVPFLWFPPRLNYLQKQAIPDSIENPNYPVPAAATNALGRQSTKLERINIAKPRLNPELQ